MKLMLKLAFTIIAISLVALCLIFFFTWTANVKTLETKTKDDLEELAFHALDKIDRNFFERSGDIRILANDPVIISRDSTPQQITERLIAYRNTYKMYVSLSFFDLNRVRIADTSGLRLGMQDVKNKYWDDVLQGQLSIASDIEVSASLGSNVIFFASPVRDKNGQLFGVVTARMAVDRLYEIVGDISISKQVKETVRIDLVDKEGKLIYSSHNRKGILRDNLSDWGEDVRDFQGKNSGFKSPHKNPGGEESISVFYREQGYLDFQGNDWILIVHIPTRVVFASVVDLRNKWLLVIIPFALLAVIISIILAIRYSKPLTKLRDAANEVGSGNLNVRVNIKSYDEIGDLVNVFNRMVSNLQENMTSIGRLEQEMDQRKKIEIALKESEEWFSTTLKSIGDAVIATDEKGRVKFINYVAEQLTGWKYNEAVGKSLDEIFHIVNEQTREVVENPVVKVLRDGGVVGLANHTVLISKEGKEVPLADSGAPIRNTAGEIIGVVLVFQDVTERKQAEDALQESEQQFMDVLYASQDAILLIDSEQFVDCNEATARMLGYVNRAELLMTHPSKLSPPIQPDGQNSFGKANEMMRIAHEKGFNRFEWVHRKANGSDFPVEVSLTPVLVKGKSVLHCVWRDISELKLAETELARYQEHLEDIVKERTELLQVSEERYRHIASAITDYIYTVLIENGRPVRTIYNPACLVVTGYSADEFREDPMLWIKVVVEEDQPLVAKQIEEILTGKRDVKPIEHRMIHKDGRICWVKNTIVLHHDTRGCLDSYDGLISDITARREAEKILEDQKRALDEHAIVSKADARGHITYVNDKFCEISQYSREELIGKDHRIINSGYHPKVFFENLWRTIKSGKVWQGKIRNRAQDGSFYWVQSTIVPVLDEGGAVKEYISARTDITQSVENEERLERAMLVKSNFVSTVSHELRTPLASIKSSIDILDTEAPGKLNEDQKIFIVRVKSNIDRLARLINDVLDLSKLESGKMIINLVPFHPEEVVRDVIEMQKSVIKNKAVTLEIKSEKGLPALSADKDRVIQVLNNLISNALKFTHEGNITVSVSCFDRKLMTFCVRDTGMGIKEEDLPKLFQKFQQVGGASQQVSGTGLGLAICKEIVERHNGRIWVESQFGKGSAFFFTVPVKHDKRILVVDDDPVISKLIRSLLEKTEKYEIESVTDGFLAGQKYLEFDPHIIILDVGLPGLNGLEVCARIKKDPNTMHTKIMMFSSFTEDLEKKCWDVGADDILNKPLDQEELFLKISKLIE
ncbi:MAG: PAS domain S-box protein [Candidatus Omnitrophica bacterium]|nr:PAS domain S-box protein [Candidatus Omnitrophota bacterium]